MIKPGWTGTWTGWHGLHQPHLDLHDGGVDPGPPRFFCSATSLFHFDAGDPFSFSSCFTVPLLGCGARMVMAKVEENKREMKNSNNQWWWCLRWRNTHMLVRWNAHVSEAEKKRKRLMNPYYQIKMIIV